MTVLLLDASAWIAALDPSDTYHADAARIIDHSAGHDLAALDLTVFEIVNVALKKWRSPEDARHLAELVEISCSTDLQRIDGETADYTIDLAERHSLTAYDAAYVAIAQRRGWTLVSTDMKDLVRPGLAITPDAVG